MIINSAYLTGVIDSDGSLSITKRHINRPNPNYTCMFALTWSKTSTSIKFMQALVNTYGGSFAECKRVGYKNGRPIIKYCATGKAVDKILEACSEHLILKRQQANNLISLRKLVHPCGHRRRRAPEISEQMEMLYVENKRINSKNGTLCESA